MVELLWASVMLVAAILVCSLVWAAAMIIPRPSRRRFRDQRG